MDYFIAILLGTAWGTASLSVWFWSPVAVAQWVEDRWPRVARRLDDMRGHYLPLAATLAAGYVGGRVLAGEYLPGTLVRWGVSHGVAFSLAFVILGLIAATGATVLLCLWVVRGDPSDDSVLAQ